VTDEEYVRSAWQTVEARWLFSMPDRFRVEMLYDSAMVWAEMKQSGLPKTEAALTEAQAWSAAAEFTRNREEEIRKVEEEIAHLRGLVILLRSEPGDLTTPIWQRVLVREHAALAELKRGLRTEEK